jgi:outer membrane protein
MVSSICLQRSRQRTAALFTLLLLGACAHRPASSAPEPAPELPEKTAQLLASNRDLAFRQTSETTPADVMCDWSPTKLQELTLGDALLRAICANTRMTDAILAVKADVAQHKVALNQYMPTLTASVQRARSYTRTQALGSFSQDTTPGTSHALTMNWLLWDFGGRLAQTRAAEYTALASFAMQDVVGQATIAATAESYLNVMTYKEIAEAAAIASASARRALELARARHLAGAGTEVDVQFAQVGVEQADLSRTKIDEQIALAKGDLAVTMNLRPDVQIRFAHTKADAFVRSLGDAPPASLDGLMRTLSTHQEVIASQQRAAATEQQIAIARSELFPKVNAIANYYFDGRPGSNISPSGSRERFVGLTVSIPIANPATEWQKIRGLRAQHERALAQTQETKLRVESGLWKAYVNTKTASASVRTAARAEHHANLAMRQAEARYRAGAVDIGEWLRALRTVTETRIESVRARSEMRLARIRLLLAIGQLAPWRHGVTPDSSSQIALAPK